MTLLSTLKRLRVLSLEPIPPEGTGLLAGRDGWLFWIGKRRSNMVHWQRVPKTEGRAAGWSRLAAKRARDLATMGIAYRYCIIPDKLSIYHTKLVNWEIDPALAIGRRANDALRREAPPGTVIDLFGPLTEARDDAELYLRTDTHFTPTGYKLAYATICGALGAAPAPHVLDAPVTRGSQETDLGSKLRPPAREECDLLSLPQHAVRAEVNDLAAFREAQMQDIAGVRVGSVIVLRNDRPEVDGRRLVVCGDSFTFADAGLGAMLAESFREVHLLWSTRLDYAYIRDVKPDIVLTATAEFFLGPVPSDEGFSIGELAKARLAAAREGRALPI